MSLLRENDTIAAIATPLGPGGIGVVRVSGALAPQMFRSLVRTSAPVSHPQSHILYHGWFLDPETGSAVDEVLAVLMKSPRSYTREDVLEIQCHSGPAILSRILDACIGLGARLADPGEFTRRAFLSGRIDLVQAEAVAEIASARSNTAGRLAVSQLQGRLSDTVNRISDVLRDCLASIEVSIDYSEEDVDFPDLHELEERLVTGVTEPVKCLLSEFQRGRIFRQGATVLIIGRPNVGKSSILNALVCEDRAIVTPVPGTTRDPVEAELNIRGVLIKFTDTAGIRKDPDPVEEIGIARVRGMFERADMILWLLDCHAGITAQDLAVGELIKDAGRFPAVKPVFNKIDLCAAEPDVAVEQCINVLYREFPALDTAGALVVSARTGRGLRDLEDAVASAILESADLEPPETGINARHRDVLARVLRSAEKGVEALRSGMSQEIAAIDLRDALTLLGEITGQGVTEEILDHLFSSFCLGK